MLQRFSVARLHAGGSSRGLGYAKLRGLDTKWTLGYEDGSLSSLHGRGLARVRGE